ncbi:hypothetical protein NQ315_002699 [Exocentrus adspersus]|uniref:Uncharacterized protein n=1 Tax=Exocentrus adspersus TaxID=1586481 RepID=A0AAV8VHV1_9CUCU|nr:hypothetical protein NQ315_002699 [Exocentrus adspersus]
MDLTKINERSLLAYKPSISVKELEVGKEYIIHKIKKITTTHGDVLVTELNDFQVFLPKRLTTDLEDHLEKFDTGEYFLISCGEKNINKVIVYILSIKNGEYSVLPAFISKQKMEKHVNLLMIQNKYFSCDAHGKDKNKFEIRYHFTWIKNLSRLVSNQISRHKRCDRCLNYFGGQAKLEMHETDCTKINNGKISFPEEKYLFFKNVKFKDSIPFVIYSDVEAILKPVDDNQ